MAQSLVHSPESLPSARSVVRLVVKRGSDIGGGFHTDRYARRAVSCGRTSRRKTPAPGRDGASKHVGAARKRSCAPVPRVLKPQMGMIAHLSTLLSLRLAMSIEFSRLHQ